MNKYLVEFFGAKPTTEFIRTFDALFDYDNNRDPYGKNSKGAIKRLMRTVTQNVEKCCKNLNNLYLNYDGLLIVVWFSGKQLQC